jgi:cytochrome c
MSNSRSMLLAIAAASLLTCGGCHRERDLRYADAARMTNGGNPQAGIAAIQKYGCSGCHMIDGVQGARGMVGPPLDRFAYRIYIAGRLPNTPENLMHWIQKPQEVWPGNAMPQMGVTDQDSRDIAAYLYTLR